MMRVESYFTEYETLHQTPGNRLCHSFGVPFIMLALLGLLSHIVLAAPINTMGPTLLRLDGGILLWTVAFFCYLIMDWKIGLPFSVVSLGVYFLARTLPPGVLWTLLISGWIIQYFGHLRFEKNSPAFHKNLLHLLVGPLWLFSKAVGYPK